MLGSDTNHPRNNVQVPEWIGQARGHGLLSRLPDPLVAEFAAGAQRVQYPAGGVGLRWDEEPKTAILLSGTARAFLSYPDGNQITTRYLKPGDMAGVFAQRVPRIARGVQALEPCEMLIVDAARVKQLSLSHPAFGWALIEEMTTVLNGTQRALYVRAFGTVRQRVALTIIDRARLCGGPSAGQRIAGTQAEMAIAAGTVREVVAGVLHDLKGEGIIDVRRGAVLILEPSRLEAELSGNLALTA